jgi:hypothetical protein
MNGSGDLGKALIVIGVVVAIVGGLLLLGGRIGLGRLPGDIVFKKGSFTFYFPLVTSILLSLLLTLILWIFRR